MSAGQFVCKSLRHGSDALHYDISGESVIDDVDIIGLCLSVCLSVCLSHCLCVCDVVLGVWLT